jgi:hypothetical protein
LDEQIFADEQVVFFWDFHENIDNFLPIVPSISFNLSMILLYKKVIVMQVFADKFLVENRGFWCVRWGQVRVEFVLRGLGIAFFQTFTQSHNRLLIAQSHNHTIDCLSCNHIIT